MQQSQDKPKEIEFFDTLARKGAEYDVFHEAGYHRLFDAFATMVRPQPGQLLLDIGCGTGAVTRRIADRFELQCVGLDISLWCARMGRTTAPHIPFLVGDAEQVPFSESSLDIVTFSALLHHFADFRTVAAEAYRVLRDGGRFFSFDPNVYNPAMWLYRGRNSPLRSDVGVTENERLLSQGEITSVFQSAGLRTQAKAVSGLPFRYVESDIAQKLLPVYNTLDRTLGALPIAQKVGAFVVCAGTKTPRTHDSTA